MTSSRFQSLSDAQWEQIAPLLAFTPQDLGGRFSTTFADGSEGERGSWWFSSPQAWAVVMDDGPTMVSMPGHSLVRHLDGLEQIGPGMGASLPRRPPWSLAYPRVATVFGREHDDWCPESLDSSGRRMTIRSIEVPDEVGSVLISARTPVILGVSTPGWEEALSLDEEAAALPRALLEESTRSGDVRG